jgi:hypothetical protein
MTIRPSERLAILSVMRLIEITLDGRPLPKDGRSFIQQLTLEAWSDVGLVERTARSRPKSVLREVIKDRHHLHVAIALAKELGDRKLRRQLSRFEKNPEAAREAVFELGKRLNELTEAELGRMATRAMEADSKVFQRRPDFRISINTKEFVPLILRTPMGWFPISSPRAPLSRAS